MADASGRAAGHEEHVPCQLAVYVRRTNRDRFSFSHIRSTTIAKLFPRSLSVRDLSLCEDLRKANERAYKTAPVLILVTGDRAEMVSYASNASLSRRVFFKYDHSERQSVSEEQRLRPTYSELSRGYMAMSLNCTVACYERGPANDWALSNVIPMLSDWIVIPRVIGAKNVDAIIRSYCKAAMKCLKDSRFLAGGQRFREATLTEMVPAEMQYSPENDESHENKEES